MTSELGKRFFSHAYSQTAKLGRKTLKSKNETKFIEMTIEDKYDQKQNNWLYRVFWQSKRHSS
jgi:hypothetical protein